MRHDFSGERNSAPTGANETVNDMKLDAKGPLGGATCCASDFSIPDGYEPYAIDEDLSIWNMLWENSEGKDMSLLKRIGEDVRVPYGR